MQASINDLPAAEVARLQGIANQYPDTVDYMALHGNPWEKAIGKILKEVKGVV